MLQRLLCMPRVEVEVGIGCLVPLVMAIAVLARAGVLIGLRGPLVERA